MPIERSIGLEWDGQLTSRDQQLEGLHHVLLRELGHLDSCCSGMWLRHAEAVLHPGPY